MAPKEKSPAGRILALGVLLLVGCASEPGYWDISSLPEHGPDVVELRANDGTLLVVKRERLLAVRSVTENLARAARVHVDHLMFVDHIAANAWVRRRDDGKTEIGVTDGMLELLGEDVDMLAALMGHELGHLALKHSEERKTDPRAQSDALAFSRHQERLADEFGVRIAFAAGYDPEGMLRLNRRLQERAPRGRYLRTHPTLLEREADIYRLVSGYARAAEGSKAVRLWSLIGLGLEQRPDGLVVRRLGVGSTGNLMVGDRIVALEAPVEQAVSDLDDVLKVVAPNAGTQSFRFSVVRRDARMPAYFHSRRK